MQRHVIAGIAKQQRSDLADAEGAGAFGTTTWQSPGFDVITSEAWQSPLFMQLAV